MTEGTSLQRGYTFWYMRRGRGSSSKLAPQSDDTKDASEGTAAVPQTDAPKAVTPYENTLKRISTVRTVEEFWKTYNYLVRPNQIVKGDTPLDYHFFVEGVKPTWEDEGNAKGGKWIVRLKKGLASRYWEEMLLAIIGGQFSGVLDGEVCGAVISIRYSEDIVSLWNKNADDIHATDRLRDAIKKILRLPSGVHMEYKPHQVSLQDRSSFRNTQVWKPKHQRNKEQQQSASTGMPAVDARRGGSWSEKQEGGGNSTSNREGAWR